MSLPISVYIAVSILLELLLLVLIIKLRYKKFTSRDFVLFYRRGLLRTKGYGGAYFLLPLIDQIIVLPTSVQRVNFEMTQQIIFKPKFRKSSYDKKIDNIIIKGFLLYKVKEPQEFYNYSRLADSFQSKDAKEEGNRLIKITNEDLYDVIVGYLKRIVLEEPLDDLYTNRSNLLKKLQDHIQPNMNNHSMELVDMKILDIVLD